MALIRRFRSFLARFCVLLPVCMVAVSPSQGWGQGPATPEYLIGAGDVLKINVFQNPELTLEARVAEDGTISYPLIGSVTIGGGTITAAERRISQMLKDGGFVLKPQVSILLETVRGSQISVLGQVNRPGRYPIETANTRLTDALATAGGIAPTGADTVVFVGTRAGKQVRQVIDLAAMFSGASSGGDMLVQGGDILYVQRAPVFYIYGEVIRPGSYRLERAMTVMQALAAGGGLTPKGTQRGLRLNRRGGDGKMQELDPGLNDLLQPDDVVYVKESLF